MAMSTPLKLAPEPVDNTELFFQRTRFANLSEGQPINLGSPKQLVAASSKNGILFVGTHTGLAAIKIDYFEKLDEMDVKTHGDTVNDLQKIRVELPSPPIHMAVNADETVIVVATELNGKPHLYFFDIRAFNGQAKEENIKPFTLVATTLPPSVTIKSLNWNPVMASMLAALHSDGSMSLYMLNNENVNAPPDCCTLPPAEGIQCISWSPKGKQLVAGKINGALTQYKPDLKEAKTIPPPMSSNGEKFRTKSILWISTYQFLVAYENTADPDGRPVLVIVQSSKAGNTEYYNYDDICYSSGNRAEPDFQMTHIPEWDIIIASSSNSIEVGILGACKDSPGYVQWLLTDTGRAELPMNPSNNSERFPVGLAVAFCTQRRLKINETRSYDSPMPLLFLLADDYLLCGFYIVNSAKDAKNLTTPPQPMGSDNMRPGIIEIPKAVPSKVQLPPQTSFVTPVKSEKPSKEATPPPKPLPTIASTPKTVPQSLPTFGGNSVQSPKPFNEPAKPPPPSVFGMPSKSNKDEKPPANISSNAETTKNVKTEVSQENQIESSCRMAVKEEICCFEQELALFRESCQNMNLEIGSDKEKLGLRKHTDEMSSFCSDLKEITLSQSKEIRELQKLVLECYEWTEEAKSRDKRNKDPKYLRLLKNKGLDPLNQRRLSNLKMKFSFLEQELNEANHILDLEWQNHLKDSKGHGLSSKRIPDHPSKVSIYQALVLNNQILEKERAKVNDICKMIEELKLKSMTDERDVYPDQIIDQNFATELENLTDSFLRKSTVRNIDHIKKSPHLFSPEKESALRNHLQNRGLTRIVPATPKSPKESSFLRSDIKKESDTKKQIEKLKEKEKSIPSPKFFDKSTKEDSFNVNINSTQPASELKPNLPMASAKGSFLTSSPILTKPSGNNAFQTPKPVSTTSSSTFSLGGSKESQLPLTSEQKLNKEPQTTTNVESKPVNFGANVTKTGAFAAPKPTFSFASTPAPSSGFFSSGLTGGLGKSGFTSVSTSSSTNGSNAFSAPAVSQKLSLETTSSALPTSSMFSSSATVSTSGTTGTTSLVTTSSFSFSTTTQSSSVLSGVVSPLAAISTGSVTSSENIKPSFGSGASIFGASTTNASQGSIIGSSETAVSSSIFGEKPNTSSGGIFGATSSASGGIFGSNQVSSSTDNDKKDYSSSIFGTKASGDISTLSANSQSLTTGISAVQKATTTAANNVDKSSTSASTTSSGSGGIFGATVSQSSPFGASGGQTSIFGAKASAPSAFSSGAESTSTLVFGSTTSSTTPTSSSTIFGTKDAAASSSIFGSAPATSTSLFVSTTPATSTSSSVFGSTTSAPSTTSVFGSKTSAPSTTSSLFGSTTSAPSATSSVFGSTTSAPSTTSVFGSKTSAPSTNTSVFGSTTSTPSTANASLFGSTTSAPSTTNASVFGSTSPPSTTTTSVFGSSAPGASKSSSLFGTAPSAPSTTSSLFGSTTSSTASVFGSSTTAVTTASSSIFGSANASTLGSPASQSSIFGTPASASSSFGNAASTTQSSLFGGSSGTSNSGFGTAASGASSLFGAQPSTSSSVFGASSSTTSTPFASGSTIAPAFGQSLSFGGSNDQGKSGGSGNIFGSPSTAAGSIFGGAKTTSTTTSNLFGNTSSTPFGSKPSVFGSSATNTSSSGLFGNAASTAASTSPFSATSTAAGSPFASTTQTTFGGQATFGSPSAFGSAPKFGGAPAFGGSPSFGGAPSFGSPPAFGSGTASSSFGSTAFGSNNANTFGQSASSNEASFGSLAQANLPSFGSMAQQQSPTFGSSAQGSGFGQQGSSSFGGFGSSSTSSFSQNKPSGSSFSSWR